MKEAIDKLSNNRLVCAEQFYGQSIQNKRSRFTCPYCFENVRYRKRGGKHPDYFFHLKKTESTIECDRRIAQSEREIGSYQRIGLPMCLKDEGSCFHIYLMFPPLGDELIDQAKKQKAKVVISDEKNNYNRKEYYITPYRFCDELSTPITVKFIPCGEKAKYAIEVSADTGIKSKIEKKWANYSDGFTKSGAIFNYNDFGDNRIRFGSSMPVDRLYYLVSNDNEVIDKLTEWQVDLERKGQIALGNYNYYVYLLKFGSNFTDNKSRYSSVKRLIDSKFRVSLTEGVTKLNLLWPPAVVRRDVNILVKDADSIYCAFSGSNKIFEVGLSDNYVKNKDNDIILRSISKNDVVVSVESNGKLQIDNSLFLSRQCEQKLTGDGAYEFRLSKDNGEAIKLSKLKPDSLSGNCIWHSNAKMEVYIRDSCFKYSHIEIRNSETEISLPKIKNLAEIICLVEKGIQLTYLVDNANCDVLESEESLLKRIASISFGEYVTAPMWFRSLLLKWQREKKYKLVLLLKKHLIEGKVPYGLIAALLRLKLQKKY